MAIKNGFASLAGAAACVSKHTASRRAVLKAFAYIIPKQNILRPRTASLVGICSTSARGDNFRGCPPVTADFVASLTAVPIRKRVADPADIEISGAINAVGGRVHDFGFLTANLDAAASSSVSVSRAAGASASLVNTTFFKAFWSKLSPPLGPPMVGRAKCSGSARRQGNASASIAAQPLSFTILAGVPRPAFANLFSEFEDTLGTAVVHRVAKAFPTISATASVFASRKRRAKAAVSASSQMTALRWMIEAAWTKQLKSSFAISSNANVVRSAMAWLPAHKAKTVSKAMRSPSASLVGLGFVIKFWPDVIKSVSASLAGTATSFARPAFGSIMSGVAAFVGSARRNRHAFPEAVTASLALVSSAALVEGPKPSLSAASSVEVFASRASNASATISASALVDSVAIGPAFLRFASAVSTGSSCSGQPTFIEGPKAQFVLASSFSGTADFKEGPKTSLNAMAFCDVTAARHVNAFGRSVAKTTSQTLAASLRTRWAKRMSGMAAIEISAGATREGQAEISAGATLLAGWGKDIEVVDIEIVS